LLFSKILYIFIVPDLFKDAMKVFIAKSPLLPAAKQAVQKVRF